MGHFNSARICPRGKLEISAICLCHRVVSDDAVGGRDRERIRSSFQAPKWASEGILGNEVPVRSDVRYCIGEHKENVTQL